MLFLCTKNVRYAIIIDIVDLEVNMSNNRRDSHRIYQTVKSILDTLMSFLGLILLSPLFIAIIIAIKIEDGIAAPVFFSQKRVGIHKKLFKLYKFRSMRLDTPHDTPTHMMQDPEKYITKLGKFLRKTSLDELPQLINILIGDMAVIGPRPALWNQDDLVAERDKYGANDVKPGLTGWAQINGRDELEIPEKAKLDGYYVANMSIRLDVKCFFGTLASVVRSDGVVEGGTGAMHRENAMRKKAVIITNHSYMLWRFRRELMEALKKTHDVVVVTPFVGHEDDIAALGIKTINTELERRGQNPFHDYKLLKTYKRILKSERPDIVITYSIKPNIYAGIASKKLKLRYFANVQGLGTAFQKQPMAGFVTMLYKTAFKRVEKVFFENTANAQKFLDLRIIPPEKEVILHGAGVNLEAYSVKDYPNNETTHFLYLGRIMREKGIDELFYAAQKLHDEGYNFVLDLVGFFEDEYKTAVDKLVENGIAVFHGFQQNPIPFYEKADCVVLPSYHEGMSNVLIEAAALGRPLITTNIPGCREAVNDGVTGLLVKVKDGDSLFDAMVRFLKLDRSARREMGLAGHAKAEAEFDRKAVVAATLTALGVNQSGDCEQQVR